MSNSFFNFKHFNIHQNKCAMKVCTDACLFGAWVAEKNKNITVQHAMDIGTGTGLLAMMLAQKNITVKIDAIEIDEDASMQAKENIMASLYANRINIIHGDIQHYKSLQKYDLVISNPPFFSNALKSKNEKRNTALHTGKLDFNSLLSSAKKNISSNGHLYILLNSENTQPFLLAAATFNFYTQQLITIKQTPSHKPFRSMLHLATCSSPVITGEITIKDECGEYTPGFTNFLKDYYLYL